MGLGVKEGTPTYSTLHKHKDSNWLRHTTVYVRCYLHPCLDTSFTHRAKWEHLTMKETHRKQTTKLF